ncbi:MAG: manganese efflux pump [Kiritimatiellae bacterium]|nr:manganese efflux pump [Kiritimatiellia bacterium]
MSLLTIIGIALGLTMDTFAVSVAGGVAIKEMRLRHAMLIAAAFGLAQALMPLAGWVGGHWARAWIASCDHWIAFGLLALVGSKMIYEARHTLEEREARNLLDPRILLMLAFATSIDALAVGLTLSFLNVSILLPVLVIGVVTFLMSLAGTYTGNTLGHLFEGKLETVGGLILIGIGVKILVEHLCRGC